MLLTPYLFNKPVILSIRLTFKEGEKPNMLSVCMCTLFLCIIPFDFFAFPFGISSTVLDRLYFCIKAIQKRALN